MSSLAQPMIAPYSSVITATTTTTVWASGASSKMKLERTIR